MSESKTKNDRETKRSSSALQPAPEDDEDKQVKTKLLDSPKTEVKQPKKKMPFFKKKAATDQAAEGGGDASMFDITLDQLKELMKERGKDLMEKLSSSEYNGVKGVLEKLKADGNKGLDSSNEQDLEQRRTAYGRNEVPPKPLPSFLILCWKALHDMLLVILLVCAVVSIGLSFYKAPKEPGEDDEPNLEWIEGVAILVAVLVVVIVTAFNDWRKERQFRGLEDKVEKDQQTSVIRDNGMQQVPTSELAVGDLCFIKYGDILPADGLLVQSSDLKVDESKMTGETNLIEKSEKEDVGLISGSQVMEGSGRMVVVGVGINSQAGMLMSLIDSVDDDSDKKKKKKKKKKGKKEGKQGDEKKTSKPKSSTKVSPDTSKPDDNEDNTQTVHIENEKQHPRTRKLPPLKQSSASDEQEIKPTNKENNDNQDKKKSNNDEQKKSSTEDLKKKSNASETSDNTSEDKSDKKENNDDKQKKQPIKTDNTDNKSEKKSNSDDEQEKKLTKTDSNNDKQKKKPVNTENNENKSDSDDEQEKKSTKGGEGNNEKQKKEPVKTENNDNKSEKKPDSDDEQEKKLIKTDINEDKKKKTQVKIETNDKKSDSDDEQEKKSTKSGEDNNEEQGKKSEANKQKQNDNRPTTTSPVEPKVSDGDKKKDSKKEKGDEKEDGGKKPVDPVALAKKAGGGGGDDDDDDDDGVNESKQKSVLAAKLTRLALSIGYIGMGAAVLTLICLIIRFCITKYVVKKESATGGDVSYFISFLIQAITVVVVAVPEGLPLAVTLALAFAVRKMMTDNNLVRHLYACETMGNASTICSDKTGTLTTNRMTVVKCYVTGKFHDELPKGEEINKDLLPLLFEAISVNSNYSTAIKESKEGEGGLPVQVGNKTECALLDLIKKWGGSYEDIRKEIPQEKLTKVFTFNSARKMMSTIIQREDGYRLYTKGASEMVFTLCKSILGEDNNPKDLSDDERKKIGHDVIEKMANDGLRAICIAYKDLGKDEQNWEDEEKVVTDLICIAIVGIEDPVRDEVPKAIEQCQKAGVVVRMVTGDYKPTARSIAIKCGIIKPDDDFLVLDGKEFNKLIRNSSGNISQKKLDAVWPKLRVLARSSPTDKYNLVNGIVKSQATEHREVVAVTGDGTNDGPALKRADVGFAMGIQGTDVAKHAADIILTDDNFASIVKAMMWGRNVYDCIAKFLQFQLTANLSAGVISVVSAAAISTVPLRAVQMLWVNLVMDTLASLALATEPPTDALLNRKPYGRTKSIISPLMVRNIIGQSLYQLTIMFIILYAGQFFLGFESTVNKIQSNPRAGRELNAQFTMVFNAFVLMTLFNEINSRKLHGERNVFKGIFSNPWFYCIWLFCFGAQILIVTFGDKVFSCQQLDIKQWAWSIFFGVGSLIWQQILLFIPIEPFSKCFSAMYRVCCPCCKKPSREHGEQGDTKDGKKTSPRKSGDEDGDDGSGDDKPPPKYSTISALTNATVVMGPPPAFARLMLRKSVHQLNSEFRVINQFRSRMEKIKEQRQDSVNGNRRNSQDSDAEE